MKRWLPLVARDEAEGGRMKDEEISDISDFILPPSSFILRQVLRAGFAARHSADLRERQARAVARAGEEGVRAAAAWAARAGCRFAGRRAERQAGRRQHIAPRSAAPRHAPFGPRAAQAIRAANALAPAVGDRSELAEHGLGCGAGGEGERENVRLKERESSCSHVLTFCQSHVLFRFR